MNSINKKMEIAILGGAFDPITKGHIQIAEYVLESCILFDEVWLMPCFSHIYNKHMTDSAHRLKMCEIACKHAQQKPLPNITNPGLRSRQIKTFDYEIKNGITNVTYAIMQKLIQEDFSREKYNYSMIIGQDNANTFHNWIHHDLLAKLIRFVVVPRKGITVDKEVTWYLHSPHIYLTKDCNIMEVSSTKVREYLYRQEFSKVNDLVNPGVLDYIKEHDLYQA